VECRPGYKRVRLCVREDLYRAMVIIEASEGLKRYRIIEEALSLWLENRKRFAGGFRVLTINEDLYNQLVSIGNGSAEAGLRLLLEAYHNHQLVAPGTQAQPQAWIKAEAQVQTNTQPQVQSGEDEIELGFLEDNPWVSIIKSRGTRSN
jgi:hypothetical protein